MSAPRGRSPASPACSPEQTSTINVGLCRALPSWPARTRRSTPRLPAIASTSSGTPSRSSSPRIRMSRATRSTRSSWTTIRFRWSWIRKRRSRRARRKPILIASRTSPTRIRWPAATWMRHFETPTGSSSSASSTSASRRCQSSRAASSPRITRAKARSRYGPRRRFPI